MADFEIKRGDSHPPIYATLGIDLTTATSVTLLFKTITGSATFSRTCTIVDAVPGEVAYVWTLADAASGPLAAVNSFNIEWEILWTDSTKTTVPSKGYKTLEVGPDLG